MGSEIILETEDLTKEFAGFIAVNGVSLRVKRRTVHALIGPNGAGKTTCFNMLTKFLSPRAGASFSTATILPPCNRPMWPGLGWCAHSKSPPCSRI